MPQFPVHSSNIDNDTITISDKENYHHLTRSLRIRKGEKLKLIDENENFYITQVTDINSYEIKAKITEKYKSFRKLNFELTLAQGVLHSDAQNMLIQKATELGVSKIIPFLADNCAVKKELSEKKVEKWRKIAFESYKQCERANIPEITSIKKLKEIDFSSFDKVIICSEIEREKTLKNCDIKKAQKILIIVGVEGGFSEKEFDFFKEQNFDMISLGNLILKAETAVISAISTLVYKKENE